MRFNVTGHAPGYPKSASNEKILQQPQQFKIVANAPQPAPMAKVMPGLRPANRTGSEGN
jgi:hypothetical protein